jgi:hypothetical protein
MTGQVAASAYPNKATAIAALLATSTRPTPRRATTGPREAAETTPRVLAPMGRAPIAGDAVLTGGGPPGTGPTAPGRAGCP